MSNYIMDYYSKKDINNIRSMLRQAYHMSDHYKGFLQTRRLELPQYKKDGSRSKRDAVRYQCDCCKELVSGTNIDVDHIDPIGSFKSLDEIERFIKRVYCSWDNLQILCVHCHAAKTSMEMDFRRVVF
jgi:5-methylcytosine-specific restriction endonuclease McrA